MAYVNEIPTNVELEAVDWSQFKAYSDADLGMTSFPDRWAIDRENNSFLVLITPGGWGRPKAYGLWWRGRFMRVIAVVSISQIEGTRHVETLVVHVGIPNDFMPMAANIRSDLVDALTVFRTPGAERAGGVSSIKINDMPLRAAIYFACKFEEKLQRV